MKISVHGVSNQIARYTSFSQPYLYTQPIHATIHTTRLTWYCHKLPFQSRRSTTVLTHSQRSLRCFMARIDDGLLTSYIKFMTSRFSCFVSAPHKKIKLSPTHLRHTASHNRRGVRDAGTVDIRAKLSSKCSHILNG